MGDHVPTVLAFGVERDQVSVGDQDEVWPAAGRGLLCHRQGRRSGRVVDKHGDTTIPDRHFESALGEDVQVVPLPVHILAPLLQPGRCAIAQADLFGERLTGEAEQDVIEQGRPDRVAKPGREALRGLVRPPREVAFLLAHDRRQAADDIGDEFPVRIASGVLARRGRWRLLRRHHPIPYFPTAATLLRRNSSVE